jgi:hypothetical protein
MVKENITAGERKWRLALKTLDKRYKAFISESPETKPVIASSQQVYAVSRVLQITWRR